MSAVASWFSLGGRFSGLVDRKLPQRRVIYRVPLGFRLTLPSRSACRTCKRRLSWAENIPVLSYILLKGRCRGCFTKIGGRYPLVELMTAALFVAVLLRCGMGFATVYYCCFSALLVAVTFIDLDHRIIPDVISLPGMALGLIGGIWVSQIGFSFAATRRVLRRLRALVHGLGL